MHFVDDAVGQRAGRDPVATNNVCLTNSLSSTDMDSLPSTAFWTALLASTSFQMLTASDQPHADEFHSLGIEAYLRQPVGKVGMSVLLVEHLVMKVNEGEARVYWINVGERGCLKLGNVSAQLMVA